MLKIKNKYWAWNIVAIFQTIAAASITAASVIKHLDGINALCASLIAVFIVSSMISAWAAYWALVGIPLRDLINCYEMLAAEVERATDRFDEYMRCNNTEIHDIKEDIQYLKFPNACKALDGSEEKPKKQGGKK